MTKLIVITLIMISGTLQAQTIILINGEPAEVVLNQSEIVEVIPSDVKDHMKEYDTSKMENSFITNEIDLRTVPTLKSLANRDSKIVVIGEEGREITVYPRFLTHSAYISALGK